MSHLSLKAAAQADHRQAIVHHSRPLKRTSRLLGGALLLLTSLTLCTGVQAATAEVPSPKTQKEFRSMTTNAPSSIETKITAEQALRRLLALIGSSQSITEWTPERLGQAMGVPIIWANNGANRYGFGAPLTPQWDIGFGINHRWINKKEWPLFEFIFNPNPPGTSPSMIDICQFDYGDFAAGLNAIGFEHHPFYDSPPPLPSMGRSEPMYGPLMYVHFYRPNGGSGMNIQVYPRGVELQARDRENERVCVKMILID
jgi:hypothetical protein